MGNIFLGISIMKNSLLTRLEQAAEKSKQGDYDATLVLYHNLLSDFPGEYEIYEARSEFFFRMNDYENAFSDLENVIKLMPNEIAPIFRRGRWNLKLGNYQKTVVDMSKVITERGEYFIDTAYFFRAEAFFYLHEYEKALLDCEHIPNDLYLGPDHMTKKELNNKINKG